MSEVKGTKMERLTAFMENSRETKKRDFLITNIDVVNDLSSKEKYVNVASAGILKYPKHPRAPFSIKNLKKTYATLKSIGINNINLDKPNLFIRVKFVSNTITSNTFKLINKLGGRKYTFNKIEFKEGSNQIFIELLVNLNYLNEEKQLKSLEFNIDEDFREIFGIIDPQEPFDTVVIMYERNRTFVDPIHTPYFELNVISLIHDLTNISTRCNKSTTTYTLHFNMRRKLAGDPCADLVHAISPRRLYALETEESENSKYKLFGEDTDENVTSVKVVKDNSDDRREREETMEKPETNSETESESRDNSAAALAHFFKFLSDTFDD